MALAVLVQAHINALKIGSLREQLRVSDSRDRHASLQSFYASVAEPLADS
jgi:hypothetical protein